MNLGLGIDTAVTPGQPAQADSSKTTPAPGAGSRGTPPFGLVMAHALQQHQAQGGPGTPGQGNSVPGEHLDATDLLAAVGTELGASGESDTPAPGQATDALLTDAQLAIGLPEWMQAGMALPAVQHITVGPSLQAITAADPAPDANSLAAFARQQGLDTAAIAWLLNPATRGGSDLPLPLPGTSVATPAALTLTPTVAAPTLPSAPVSTGARLGGLLGSATALSASLGGAQTGTALASPQAAGADGLTVAGAALTQGATQRLPDGTPAGAQIGTAGPAGLLQPSSLSLETTAPGGPSALGSPTGELSHLRWSQAIAAAQANPQNPAGAAVNMPATSTAWTEISLDLSGDGGDSGNADEANPNASQSGLSAQPSPTPALGEGHGLHKAQALSFQARLTAQPGLASGLSQGSDQMQQLSEKMADAIGQRMLRELEKGEMNLRLSLKPAHLGHIEVEMRLRAGELDATFSAPQAATRELLQDGLTRLRDSLAQAGMDVAYLNVKNGQNRQNGGDSTAGQRKSAQKDNTSEATDHTVATVESTPRPRRSDGWDVMV